MSILSKEMTSKTLINVNSVESNNFYNIHKCQSIHDVRTTVCENHQNNIFELSEDHRVSCGLVHSILTEDFGMRGMFAKFVPKLFSAEQKNEDCISAALNLLEYSENRTLI
ncbi:hypothetical protein AVEN_234251-1 [Araneus ventricosus]|uniref:Uncharacterized protein n=1 Tax=Araneus ventricosus TaxID=182803 RepID=A0A4Y2AAE6_ARAVE|nr:hypothetical protein AVEN_234251-1 [Araneus ventricosus]